MKIAKFNPNQDVLVSAYDLFYKGRVVEVIFDGSDTVKYYIEFCKDGEILFSRFNEEQLCVQTLNA